MIGVNLLTCGRPTHPQFLQAMKMAVRSLLESDLTSVPHQIVVIDDGSTDATPDWCEEQGLSVIRLARTSGIAAARNVGYRRLLETDGIEAIAEIHSDMIFPSVWLRPLLEAMTHHPRLGIACSSLLTQRGIFGSPRLSLDYSSSYGQLRERVEQAAGRHRKDRCRPGLQHPCLKRTEMLKQIGLYDEGYAGANFEDTDEVYRAAAAGWTYEVIGQSVVYHYYLLSRLTLRTDHHASFQKNYAYFVAKYPDAHTFLLKYNREVGELYKP